MDFVQARQREQGVRWIQESITLCRRIWAQHPPIRMASQEARRPFCVPAGKGWKSPGHPWTRKRPRHKDPLQLCTEEGRVLGAWSGLGEAPASLDPQAALHLSWP